MSSVNNHRTREWPCMYACTNYLYARMQRAKTQGGSVDLHVVLTQSFAEETGAKNICRPAAIVH